MRFSTLCREKFCFLYIVPRSQAVRSEPQHHVTPISICGDDFFPIWEQHLQAEVLAMVLRKQHRRWISSVNRHAGCILDHVNRRFYRFVFASPVLVPTKASVRPSALTLERRFRSGTRAMF